MCRIYRKYYSGSYTVELSLLFPFILFVLFLMIYTGFYVHNRAITEEAVYEAVIYGAALENKSPQKVQKQVKQRIENRIKGRLFSVQDKSMSVKVNEKEVKVTIRIKMKNWNYLSMFESYINSRDIQYSESARYIYPEKMVNIAKIIQK